MQRCSEELDKAVGCKLRGWRVANREEIQRLFGKREMWSRRKYVQWVEGEMWSWRKYVQWVEGSMGRWLREGSMGRVNIKME
jgi:hypothetical protein